MNDSRPQSTANSDTEGGERLAYSVRRAAQVLDMQERYVWELVRRGDIRSFKIGALRRIARADLEAFIDRSRAA